MIWLWRDSHDAVRMADHVGATLWYIAPSIPMFLLILICCGMAGGSGRRWARAAH
jgi:hypothetical protein